MTQASHIDPRLGEEKFRFFEPYIAEALSRWPQPTPMTPPRGMAYSTFCARFRDCLQGYRIHRWQPYLFISERFDEIDPHACISMVDGQIVFRARRPQGRPQSTSLPSLVIPTSPDSPLTTIPDDELTAIALLVARGRLSIITLPGDHCTRIEALGHPNVFPTYNPSSNVTIL